MSEPATHFSRASFDAARSKQLGLPDEGALKRGETRSPPSFLLQIEKLLERLDVEGLILILGLSL